MKDILFDMFAKFPLLEVLSKKIMVSDKARNFLKRIFISSGSSKENIYSKDDYINAIDNLRIYKGDVLIVHSSTDQLAKLGISPVWMIEYLLKKVGDSGTLVIPAFPLYTSTKSECLTYDVKRTPCWTGMMPNIFLRCPGVVRSEYPYNTLAAKGALADYLMENNLNDGLSYGINSAWVKCVNNHAKVLFLGTPAFHTTTISHIPEDLLGEKWPIRKFHRLQKFIINNGESVKEFNAFIRDETWSSNLKSQYRTHLLKDKGFLKEDYINGVYLGFIHDSKQVVDLLTEMALNGKTAYYVPRKYKK